MTSENGASSLLGKDGQDYPRYSSIHLGVTIDVVKVEGTRARHAYYHAAGNKRRLMLR